MADVSWQNNNESLILEKPRRNRLLFVIGGLVLISAVVFLVVNAMSGNTQLYKTVGEFYAERDRLVGRDLRVAGWVIGDSIIYTQIDAQTSRLEFDIVDDLNNPTQRLHIVAMNEPKPDLLQGQAQALVEGSAGADGVFMSNPGGLMLKCPTRYEEMDASGHPTAVPMFDQTEY
ncbi:cytochrome c maturation protein CcmE [Promineifilum sp.]|uniref:cytochrome c maturation protein CcmE n=1 Tax=Promineifilum sp. TaxID=2664178 RepID=UPI0035AFB18B